MRHKPQPNPPFYNVIIPFFRRNRRITKSILIFSSCIIVFMLAYSGISESSFMVALSTAIANVTGLILKSLSFNIQVVDTSIASADFSMTIVDACTGIIPMAIVVSAVIAYPSSFKDKGKGIVLGIVGLFIINVIRKPMVRRNH